MNLSDIVSIRLKSQQITSTKFKTAKQIISWLGAMQAQDYAMAKWGIGVRLPGSTNEVIETALNKGEIIRTHLLRPTWHFVSPDDIYWMLELTAPQIKSSMKSRNKELKLTKSVIEKSNKIIVEALSKGEHLTRDELKKEFEKNNIATGNNRLSHLLFEAELDGLICSGNIKNKKQTYALLSRRVPIKKILTKEESLAELAKRYFSSHCPATIHDFIWWSGLTVKDAKNALELVKPNFISETIDYQTYWLTNSFSIPKNNNKISVHLLPAYDEFIISYKTRHLAFPSGHFKKAVSSNGIFRPVIIVNGQVEGLWKRIINKDKVIIETEFFQQPKSNILSLIKKKAGLYGNFFRMKTELYSKSN